MEAKSGKPILHPFRSALVYLPRGQCYCSQFAVFNLPLPIKPLKQNHQLISGTLKAQVQLERLERLNKGKEHRSVSHCSISYALDGGKNQFCTHIATTSNTHAHPMASVFGESSLKTKQALRHHLAYAHIRKLVDEWRPGVYRIGVLEGLCGWSHADAPVNDSASGKRLPCDFSTRETSLQRGRELGGGAFALFPRERTTCRYQNPFFSVF